MKVKAIQAALLATALTFAVSINLQAAPSLPITEPPVTSTFMDGPMVDPWSTNGQWFLSIDGTKEYRTHEFYDNVTEHGGSNPHAIDGRVSAVTLNTFGHITAFTVKASIDNNTPQCFGQESDSNNSHGEFRPAGSERYIGPLLDTKLTVEFAIADANLLPAVFSGPYQNPWPPSFIIAENEDQRAWYCWNEQDLPQGDQPGNYYVPTWDFGDIAVGDRTTRVLNFSVSPPMDPSDPRYPAIYGAYEEGKDMFANRTTSLKISTWIDGISTDFGTPYPEEVLRSSDVSVFHNIEEEPQDEFDWGDAPDAGILGYPTLAANSGANHLIAGGSPQVLRLGWLIDGEPDGQPDSTATGDDLANLADEDGITFDTPLIPGTVAQVTVYAGVNAAVSGFARLQGWVDFNADGIWGPAEQIFSDQVVSFTGLANPTILTFPVPGGATPGPTFARFRLSTAAGLNPAGSAPDGEVEDYLVDILEGGSVDWGDAPDPSYPTLAANNGAHHLLGPLFMGSFADPEPDGQPHLLAMGDDFDSLYPSMGDDENGVIFTSPIQPGGFAKVYVYASISGILDAWIDFNADGDWADSGERIFSGQPLNLGVNHLIYPVPLSAAQGAATFARFRASSTGVASYTGLALDGEVEDYQVNIEHVPLLGIDFGDAPGPSYPTLLPLGARHPIVAGVGLGAMIDGEPNGQPTAYANGDDTTNFDDEDGVTFATKLVVGSTATVHVVAGVLGGYLDAWIDFDQNGSFDASEHIPPGGPVPVPPGLNTIGFAVPTPPAAKLGPTFARFRITSVPGGLAPGEAAQDGEVEDYMVKLFQPQPTNLVITNLSFNVSNTVATVEWTAQSGITYQMQATTNLVTSNSWADVESPVLGPVNWQTNNMSAQTNKFYRVTAPWTP